MTWDPTMNLSEATIAQMAARQAEEKAKRAAKAKAAKAKRAPTKRTSTTNHVLPPPLHHSIHDRGGYDGRVFGPLQVSRKDEFEAGQG